VTQMTRIKCTVSYDGCNFKGYQIQDEHRTVQGEIETVLKKIHKGEHIRIASSGRTDAGVHAYGQVFHFDSGLSIPEEKWKVAINSLLPADIHVLSAVTAADDFHARFDVIKKEYRYRVLNDKDRDVFKRNYTLYYPHPLNLSAINEALGFLKGTHDFTSFSSARTEVQDKVRTIYEAECLRQHDEIIFRIVGNGFLYNMVRIIVGTMLEVGRGDRTPTEISSILQSKQREQAGKTAAGHGLYLWHVSY
jgi:tRNA pseudouridine38-40 synthase